MIFAAGTRLGPYEVLALIGTGGMGEVYRATDTKLKRAVAIKILPEAVAGDTERLARFQREAEILASMNHPHIAQIYGLEGQVGREGQDRPERASGPFLVMELVEGPTLADRIAKGPVPLDEALPIAKQIADALEAAHEQGIIHRDLKPANIKVRADGTVKVLDFGLAKAMEAGGAGPAGGAGRESASMSPTITTPAMTQVGMILGTAAYMAPEQARGRTVDKRADIWAFGAVLFDMLTGSQPFAGEDVAETLGAVIHKEPEWSRLPATTPTVVRTVLRRCLQKDPKQRLRDIGDVRLALEGAFDVPRETTGGGTRAMSTRSAATVAWAIAGAAVIAAAVLGVAYVRRAAPEQALVRTMIPPPANTSFDFDVTVGPAVISPNGRLVAFSARSTDGRTPQRLWVRALDSLEARPLAGTDGAMFPFWSPDSLSLGFYATGLLQRVDFAGGAPVVITRAGFVRGASWGADGTIVYDANDGGASIMAVSASGGMPRPVTADVSVSGVDHRSPWMLPTGRHFLYFVQGQNQIRVGSLDGGEGQPVSDATSSAIYANGRLLFMRESILLAQPFDLSSLAVSGTPVAVASGVQMLVGEPRGVFSASETGTLLYQDGGTAAAMSLAWFDRDGTRRATVGEMGSARGVFLSPDDTFATMGIIDAEQRTDLWRIDLSTGQRSRLTSETESQALSAFAAWSPDGGHILYGARRGGKEVLARELATGAGREELLFELPPDQMGLGLPRATAWSRNGTSVVYSARGGIWTLALTATQPGAPLTAKALVQDPAAQNPRLSPDGRWLAYQAAVGGRTTSGVFVEAFPDGGQRQQVAEDGSLAVWRPDGKALYYAVDGVLSVVEVSEIGGSLRFGPVRALMAVITGRGFSYDVAKDGRILALVTSEQRASRPLTLVQNWVAALKSE